MVPLSESTNEAILDAIPFTSPNELVIPVVVFPRPPRQLPLVVELDNVFKLERHAMTLLNKSSPLVGSL